MNIANGAVCAAALLLGYLGAVFVLRRLAGDPLLLAISPSADEFLFNTAGSALILYACALGIDVALTGMLRLTVNVWRRLTLYLVFLVLSVLAQYLHAPLELVWIGLLGFVIPLRIGEQVWLARPSSPATNARAGLILQTLALLTAILGITIFIADKRLSIPLVVWACGFIELSFIAGGKGDQQPALNVLLVFAPIALVLPLVLMRPAALGLLLYAALLLGVLLAMQHLFLSAAVRWANIRLFVLALAALLAVEGLVRAGPLMVLARPRGLSASMISDDTLGWMPLDFRERLNMRDLSNRSQTLTAGLSARSDSMLIVCLGGSSTEALDLPPAERWTARLEQQLRQRGIEARVVNAGVCGFSSYQLLSLFREMMPHARPDLVILYAGNNDYERSRSGVIGPRQWNELWRAQETGQGGSWTLSAQKIFSRSAAYNLLVRLAILARANFLPAESNSPAEYYRNLDELAQAAQERGAGVLFVAEATENPTAAYNNAMAEAARKHEALFLDVKPLLIERYHREELFLTYCHLNAAGSDQLAAILADFIQQQGLLAIRQQ